MDLDFDLLLNKFEPYFGKTESFLMKKFSIDTTSKNLFELICGKLIGIDGKINSSESFKNANLVLKTIRVQSKNKVKESMSFPTFNFKSIVKERWSSSTLRTMFLNTNFLFVIFELSPETNEFILRKAIIWKMPTDILEMKIKPVWIKTVRCIKKGNIVSGTRFVSGGRPIMMTNFPGMSFNGVCHVRPHAQSSTDSYELPVPDKLTGVTQFTKHCFWLNNTFIQEIIGL